MECPFCGGLVIRCGDIGPGGEEAFSLCCEIGLDLIDNHDVFAALPPSLQQLALEQDIQHREAIAAKARAVVEAYAADKPRRDAFNAKYAHLMKGDERCLSKIAPEGGLFG